MSTGRLPSTDGGIQPTVVDAKGDLLVGVAADSISRLAVGSNDQVLTADSSTSTGLKWAAAASGVPANDAATVATSQSTTSTSFTDLTTSGPAVTVTTGTKALVIVSAQIESGSETFASMGYAVSGASTVAANNSSSVIMRAGSTYGSPAWMRASAASVVTLTAGSNTFTAKYRVGSGTGTFENRAIFVMNLA